MSRRGGRGGSASSSDPNVRLSKTLSFILRHGAEKVGIRLDEQGWTPVSTLLALPQLEAFSEGDIRSVVVNNDKQRFSLKVGEDESLLIRANQGHSINIPQPDLQPITDHSAHSIVVHGTRKAAWDSIKNQGLSRMNRQHIHFASGLPGDDGVISGMRRDCDILVYINLERALRSVKFINIHLFVKYRLISITGTAYNSFSHPMG